MTKHTRGTLLTRKLTKNLKIVGEQIRLARLRRGLTIAVVAERATCSPLTVGRVEAGSPTVSIGIWLRILYALQLDEDILLLAQNDPIGRIIQDENLPKRARLKKGPYKLS